MGSIYLTWLADEFRAAGAQVKEYDNQWKTRSRSSGGFSAPPLGVSWHHTAGARGASAQSECDYMVKSSDARPTCNIYIARDGVIWVLAAGATNTSGQGGPLQLSRGTVPKDSANTTTVGMEIGNNGVGEPYPQVQIDAAFLASNVINKRIGNALSDLFSHNMYAPSRKIDPATAVAVQGPWKPRSLNNNGTWSTDDIRAEALARAGGSQPPQPKEVIDDMASVWYGPQLHQFVIGSDGSMQHKWFDQNLPGDHWSGWENMGGVFVSGVAACVDAGDTRIDVTGKGTDDGLYQKWFDGNAWTPSWFKIDTIP